MIRPVFQVEREDFGSSFALAHFPLRVSRHFDQCVRRSVNRLLTGHAIVPLLHHHAPLGHDAFRPIALRRRYDRHQLAAQVSLSAVHLHVAAEHREVEVCVRDIRLELEITGPHLRRLAFCRGRGGFRRTFGQQKTALPNRTRRQRHLHVAPGVKLPRPPVHHQLLRAALVLAKAPCWIARQLDYLRGLTIRRLVARGMDLIRVNDHLLSCHDTLNPPAFV